MKKECAIFSICLFVAAAGASLAGGADVDAEFATGSEQSVINSFIEKNRVSTSQRFDNDLDHVLAVLLVRAYPKPERRKLASFAVSEICEEFKKQTQKEIPTAQRESWISTITETSSFEKMLNELKVRPEGGLDQAHLIEAGIKGMLAGTGWAQACLLSEIQGAELKRLMEAREKPSKERGMLGIKLDGSSIIEVISGTPAAEAGLRPGDIIISIDGKKVTDKSTNTVQQSLAGLPGEAVLLTIKRADKTFPVKLRRISIADATVRANTVQPGILYIAISTFEGSGVADKVKRIVHEQIVLGASALILDLRDNSGGRPEEANAVADIFLDGKTLQIFEFRNGKRIAFRSQPGAETVELIVLTNKNTGSAAEMLAMALHDNGRGTIVGQSTAGALCGKDGENMNDKRTIIFRSEPTVLSPNGKDYLSTGIIPDIVVHPSESGEDRVLQRAIELARDKMPK